MRHNRFHIIRFLWAMGVHYRYRVSWWWRFHSMYYLYNRLPTNPPFQKLIKVQWSNSREEFRLW